MGKNPGRKVLCIDGPLKDKVISVARTHSTFQALREPLGVITSRKKMYMTQYTIIKFRFAGHKITIAYSCSREELEHQIYKYLVDKNPKIGEVSS